MPERHRILIVDDDAIDRLAVVRALRREAASIDGVEADVLEVDTVARAREALLVEEFACVFLDHNLPDGTSLDLLMELRARGLATPVVVLTGQRDEEVIVEVMRAGAVDYLPKERLHPDLVARSLRAALRFLQSQREKQAVLDELRARDRAIAAASNGISIADPRQPDCPLVYVNEAFLRMTGYTEAEVIGRNCRFLQGPGTDPAAVKTLREAIAQERSCQVLIRNYRKDRAEFWNEVTVSPVRDAHGTLTHFVGVQTDVTARQESDIERRRTQAALHASEEALREHQVQLQDAQTRLETALLAGGIATWTWDVVSDRVVADFNLASLFSVSPEDAAGGEIGVYLSAIHPEDRERVAAAIGDALATGDVYEAEYRVVLPDGSHRWLATRGRVERDAQDQAVSLPGVVLDVTEQTERTRRERFLADLAERSRTLTDPDEVIADAVRSVGEFLGVSRCVFADIDISADTTTVPTDYRADESVVSMAGTFPISAFGPYLVGEYEAGRTVVVEDVLAEPDKFPPDYLAAYQAVGVRAFIAVPVLHSARLVSLIGAHSAVPRHWANEELALIQTVVERTWLTVEVLRQQRVLAQVAEERQARAEREALLGRIGLSLRGSPDPETVLETAVGELGRALGASHCYYVSYDLDADTATVGPDWRQDGLPTIAGQYPMSQFAANRDAEYRAGHTQVVEDTSGDPAVLALDVRSLIRVPLVSGVSMTALSVTMADGPRAWTPDEVSVVEAVATQTQSALEAVRVQRREHNIAEQLQAALQPPLPEGVTGLRLAKYYEAALEEAGVGGDFYDVFPLEKGCTALVLGDLSGKGLAAAAQVSVVRNMLRAFLYSKPTLAEAATDLNRVVALNGLLSGFATLWVGCFDSAMGELRYVNLGQEPALLRRAATSEVEQLLPTGPVLGADGNAHYEESVVTLWPGDALAVFSDGVTECGPSRQDMLGIDGVTDILGQAFASEEIESAGRTAEAVTRRLVLGVDSASHGGVPKDDVCILVAVVEGTATGAGFGQL